MKKIIYIAFIFASCTPIVDPEQWIPGPSPHEDPIITDEFCCYYWHPVYANQAGCATIDNDCEECLELCHKYPMP